MWLGKSRNENLLKKRVREGQKALLFEEESMKYGQEFNKELDDTQIKVSAENHNRFIDKHAKTQGDSSVVLLLAFLRILNWIFLPFFILEKSTNNLDFETSLALLFYGKFIYCLLSNGSFRKNL